MNDDEIKSFFDAIYWDEPTMSEVEGIIQAIYGRGFADGVAFHEHDD